MKKMTIKGLNYLLYNIKEDLQIHQCIKFIYKNSTYDYNIARTSTIIAYTNDQINEWNKRIGGLNPNQEEKLVSADEFYDVDDDNTYLKGKFIITISINRIV